VKIEFDPDVSTRDGDLRFNVGPDKDVRFRRAVVQDVSVFDMKTQLDGIAATFDKTILDAKTALNVSSERAGKAPRSFMPDSTIHT